MADDKSGVDKLKDKLYSRKRKDAEDIRSPLTPAEGHAPVAWEDSRPQPLAVEQSTAFNGMRPMGGEKKKTGLSWASKFLIGSVAFFVVAAGAAAYYFFGGGTFVSTSNIDLEIVAPSLVDGGSQMELRVLVTNRNAAPLQLADLVFTYPEGTRHPDNPTQPLTTERQSIGTIQPGQQLKRTARAVLFGQEGSTKEVKVSLEYSLEGSNAIFVREGSVSFTLGSSPVSITVDSPETVAAGQAFVLDVTVQSNAQEIVEDVALEAQYPFGFSIQNVSPKADAGTTYWQLGSMPPGSTKVVRIRGTLDGQDGDERVFRFLAGSESDQTAAKIKVPFITMPTSITVSRPFISGTLSVGGNTADTVAVEAGKGIQGTIAWRNNLPDAVSNLEVSLKIEGPILDPRSVESSNGFYQSANNTITWTSAQDPTLANVAPGGSGTLNFSFGTLAPGAGGTIYTNPKITLTLGIKGTRGSDQSAEAVTAADTTNVVLGSILSLEAQSYFGQGVYSNTGPTPPRAESPTTYTVTWTVKNSSNAIANAQVSAVLPPYVTYKTGQAGFTFDAASRTVRWDIGEIKAGAGYTATAAKAGSFQVSITPSISQVGQVPALTGSAVLTGTDRFAQIQLQAQAQGPTTETADNKNGQVEQK